jgi:hypothetical protein
MANHDQNKVNELTFTPIHRHGYFFFISFLSYPPQGSILVDTQKLGSKSYTSCFEWGDLLPWMTSWKTKT